MFLESDATEFPKRPVREPIFVLKLTQAIFGHRPGAAVILQPGFVVCVAVIETQPDGEGTNGSGARAGRASTSRTSGAFCACASRASARCRRPTRLDLAVLSALRSRSVSIHVTLFAGIWNLDLDLDALCARPATPWRYREVSRHPRVRRDLAVLLAEGQAAGEVVEAIRKEGGASLVDVAVFDRYEGEGLPQGRVSVAFRLVFQRPDRTLKDAEVARATDRIVQMLAHRFDGELR